MLKTKNVKPILLGFVFAATLGVGATKANALDNQPSNNQWVQGSLEDGSYCHLKFPAIRQSTLYTAHPELKSASSGDMVDYYGPCNHDPLGADEIQSQRDELNMQWQVNYGGSD
jgi:hypothetical protein